MPTPYETLCDEISIDISGLTPPDLTNITYTRIADEIIDWGLSADRCFYFEWITSIVQSSQGITRFDLRETFNLVINIKGARKTVETWDYGLRNEGVLIMNKINSRSNWPVGIHGVTCENIDIRTLANGEDAQIALKCRFLSFNTPP